MTKYLLPLAAFALIGCGEPKEDCEDTAGCDTAPPEECEDTAGCETGDTTPPDTEIDVVTYGYDAAEWTYQVDVLGWAESASMYVTQDTASPWEEDHDLQQIDFDPDGWWDVWGITLPITTEWDQQESGVNTLFAGTAEMEATMLWRIDVYDAGEVVDCVYWAGASADVNKIADDACREITF